MLSISVLSILSPTRHEQTSSHKTANRSRTFTTRGVGTDFAGNHWTFSFLLFISFLFRAPC